MNFPTKFIYVGDPLCSWCYGISGELEKLKGAFPEYPFDIVVGGLRIHETTPIDDEMKNFLRMHWEKVNELSGQPFGYDILSQERSFVYDTEKPCRAVVAFRHLDEPNTLNFFRDIQSAFYRDGMDTNELETYYPLLERYDVDTEAFNDLFHKEEIRKETNDDFLWARQVGASSFPTMLLQHGQQLWAVAIGYSTFERMKTISERIFRGELPGHQS